MRRFDDVIVTCAITGAIHVPTMSEHLPITTDEIVDDAVAAAEAGASIVHIHVRDPETGKPVTDLQYFRDVATRIREHCDVIVQPTTGGAPTMPIDERVSVVPELEPEMASCNMGSINFGLYPVLDAYQEFEHDWEEEYLENSRDLIFANSFASLEQTLDVFDENGTKPELECYDIGHLHNVAHLVDRGLLEPPLHLQFVLGILGGIAADEDHLLHMKRTAEKLFGDEYSFSVIGAGRMQTRLATLSADLGGHVRVGLEDNLYLRKGELATGNAEQVDRIVSLVERLTGRDVASPNDVRSFLGLNGHDEVAF